MAKTSARKTPTARIAAANRAARGKRFRVTHIPTPALQGALDDAAHGRLEHVDDVDAWLRSIGARA